jgi:hypothetical protein
MDGWRTSGDLAMLAGIGERAMRGRATEQVRLGLWERRMARSEHGRAVIVYRPARKVGKP